MIIASRFDEGGGIRGICLGKDAVEIFSLGTNTSCFTLARAEEQSSDIPVWECRIGVSGNGVQSE